MPLPTSFAPIWVSTKFVTGNVAPLGLRTARTRPATTGNTDPTTSNSRATMRFMMIGRRIRPSVYRVHAPAAVLPLLERELGPRPPTLNHRPGRPPLASRSEPPGKPEAPGRPDGPGKRGAIPGPPDPPLDPRLSLLADQLIRDLAGRDRIILAERID